MPYFAIIFILFISGCTNNQKTMANNNSIDSVQTNRIEWIRPQIIEKSELIYPDSLKESNISGTVWIECIIDTLGNIVNKRVLKSNDNRLNQFALQTVSGYTFSSGMMNKKKIESKISFPIRFN